MNIAAVLLFSLILIPGVAHTPSSSSPQLQVYTSIGNQQEYLYVPVNSTGVNAFPVWHIDVTGGDYKIYVDGNVSTSGIGPYIVTLNLSGYSKVTVGVTIGSTTYSFTNETILQSQPTTSIGDVFIYSTMKGQQQELTVLPGQSGMLMYQNWTVELGTSSSEQYSIFVGSQIASSGTVNGQKDIFLNFSKGPVTVTVGLGNHLYNFTNELIATVPLNKYYAPPGPTLIASAGVVAEAVAVGGVVFSIFIVIGATVIRPWAISRLERKPLTRGQGRR